MNPKTALLSSETYPSAGIVGTCAYLALDGGQPLPLRIVALSLAAAVTIAFTLSRTWLKRGAAAAAQQGTTDTQVSVSTQTKP